MGLLDGGLQQAFGAAFGRLLLDGRHSRIVEARDNKGNVTGAVTKVQSVKGFRQAMSQEMREAGYAETAAQLLVMQTYEGRVLDEVLRGDKVTLDGRWVVGDVHSDPAHTHWVLWVTRDAE